MFMFINSAAKIVCNTYIKWGFIFISHDINPGQFAIHLLLLKSVNKTDSSPTVFDKD